MGTGLDLVAKRADGTTFPVDIMPNPLKHLAEPMVLAVVRDVTQRHTAEDTLRQSQGRLAAIVTSSADSPFQPTIFSWSSLLFANEDTDCALPKVGRLDVMSVPRARQRWRVTRGGRHRNFVNYS
jgi:PAS domain-containing protein